MKIGESLLGFFSIVGSVVRQTPAEMTNPQNLRRIRVDDEGRLVVVSSGGGGTSGAILGVAGDDTTTNPFRQIDFVPQTGGFRSTLTATSQEIGPLTVDKTYHVTASVDAWIVVGPTGGTAVVGNAAGTGSTHIKAGSTYEYVAKAGREYVQFIKDPSQADGYIAISRVEV